MTSNAGWDEIGPLYLKAAALPDEERASVLDSACEGRPALRAEIERMLEGERTGGAFLCVPPARLAANFLNSGPGTPESLGPYRILRVVGEGGMGTVYQAEQNSPHRIVALKVIKAGLFGDQVLRRFEQEAEALGRLQHPGIARIYDAGTAGAGTDAQPYFAMEFIDGRPLMQYAAEHALGVRARMELMAKVCDAVSHAHQRGVIHRDLKPGNILVDETGQPKILDFGVARITDSDAHATRQTDLGQLIGTLAYMSPEQATGNVLDVDFRSDLYTLGVILYELLAGKLPYLTNRVALHEAVQVIQEEDPEPLSAIDRGFRGDIETIVAKAMEKDRERRYSSTGELAGDIRRHLSDQMIVARPPSALYQLQKFSRRNKGMVLGTAAVLLALLAGTVVSTWQAARARTAEQQARRNFDDVRQLANSLLFEISDAIKDLPGSTPARMLLVKRSLTYLDKLAQQASQDVSLRNELAVAYGRIGEVQYTVGRANLGDIAGALVSARKATEIREAIARRDTGLDAQLGLASAYQRQSDLLEGTGAAAESVVYLNKALALRETLNQKYPSDERVRSDLAAGYRAAGDKQQTQANPQEALVLYRKALAVRQELVRQHPRGLSHQRQLSGELIRIADALGGPNDVNLGKFAEARKTYEEALAIREVLRKAAPASVTAVRDVSNVHQRLGSLLVQLKEYQQSLETNRAALSSYTSLWNADPSNQEVRRDMAVVESQIARSHIGLKQPRLTEEAYRRSLAIRQELYRKNPDSERSLDNWASTMSVMGRWLAGQGREREALGQFAAARGAFDQILQRNPDALLYERKRLRAIAGVAGAHAALGERAAACASYRDALAVAGRLQAAKRMSPEDENEPTRYRKELASCR